MTIAIERERERLGPFIAIVIERERKRLYHAVNGRPSFRNKPSLSLSLSIAKAKEMNQVFLFLFLKLWSTML